MIARKSNIPNACDAETLTGKRVEILQGVGSFKTGESGIVSSVDVRSNNNNIKVVNDKGDKSSQFHPESLYILPTKVEDFDHEIDIQNEIIKDLKIRKEFMEITGVPEYDESGFRSYNLEKELDEAPDPEAKREIIKKILKS